MDFEHLDEAPKTRVGTVLQVALAVLVAATLVAFSAVALRTGFAEEPRQGVAASTPGGSTRPVVLPFEGGTEVAGDQQVAADGAQGNGNGTAVLGTQISSNDAQPSVNVGRNRPELEPPRGPAGEENDDKSKKEKKPKKPKDGDVGRGRDDEDEEEGRDEDWDGHDDKSDGDTGTRSRGGSGSGGSRGSGGSGDSKGRSN